MVKIYLLFLAYARLQSNQVLSESSSNVMKLRSFVMLYFQGLVESIEHADQMVFNQGVPDMFLPVHFEPPYNGLNESIEYIHGQKIM